MVQQNVLRIVEKHRAERGALISILEEIQAEYGYLPEEALKTVAQSTKRTLVDIYGVATFYRAFSLKPRGKHLICVCLGTACHVRGGQIIAEEFRRRLGVAPGGTTPDNEFTLQTVNCLGACALGPIVVADGRYYSNVSISKVQEIIRDTRDGVDKAPAAGDRRIFPLGVSCPRCNHSLMDSENLLEGYPSIRVTVAYDQQHGAIRLSSLYGSYAVQMDHEVPMDTVVDFFCPHCHAELRSGLPCSLCGAPMVPMIVRGGGVLQICARRGCNGHMLDVSGAAS